MEGARGHPGHRAERSDALGLGVDARVPRRPRALPPRAGRRRAGRARRGACVRYGERRRRERSPHRRRHRAHGRHRPRPIAAGAVGFSTNRLPCTVPSMAARSPARSPRRTSCSPRPPRAPAHPRPKRSSRFILPTAMSYDPRCMAPRGRLDETPLAETGLRFTFVLGGIENVPYIEEANAAGAHLVPQVGCRRQVC